MQTINLWSVNQSGPGGPEAVALESVQSSETERMLEDLLVRSPDLLGSDVVLVGRQVSTEGGPLDLLGVDDEGRLVVFELKRGVLTREAIAQVLDYTSDLAAMDTNRLARLIEDSSGRGGIEQMTDFLDWYAREYPGAAGPLALPPRMVVVGLGVDERTRRIANFLVSSGLDVQLLTFHAFRAGSALLLARQVESEAITTAPPASAPGKEDNRRTLHELADSQGVKDLLEEVARFISARLPGVYVWPGKTAYSFNLPEQTAEGRPTARSYATLYVDTRRKNLLLLQVPPRSTEAAPQEATLLVQAHPEIRQPGTASVSLEAPISRGTWAAMQPALDSFLKSVAAGRAAVQAKAALEATESEVPASDEVSATMSQG
ncbi:MAG TPA: endonuclease NucS domain-containing protein [Longimicrobiaceae bacterium]|jgi:hypothetical protein